MCVLNNIKHSESCDYSSQYYVIQQYSSYALFRLCVLAEFAKGGIMIASACGKGEGGGGDSVWGNCTLFLIIDNDGGYKYGFFHASVL